MAFFRLSMLVVIGIASPNPAIAQIIPDTSLGTESRPTIQGDRTLIDGGARRSGNFFHSFSDFNVGEGQQVYFSHPVGVDRILTCVTSHSPSNIHGILGVLGQAIALLGGDLRSDNGRLTASQGHIYLGHMA